MSPARYQSRSLPYLSTLQPHFSHVHPPHNASANEVALRTVGRGAAHRGQAALNNPMPRNCAPFRTKYMETISAGMVISNIQVDRSMNDPFPHHDNIATPNLPGSRPIFRLAKARMEGLAAFSDFFNSIGQTRRSQRASDESGLLSEPDCPSGVGGTITIFVTSRTVIIEPPQNCAPPAPPITDRRPCPTV